MIARQGFTDDKHIDPVRRSLELFNDFRILDSHISAGFNDFLEIMEALQRFIRFCIDLRNARAADRQSAETEVYDEEPQHGKPCLSRNRFHAVKAEAAVVVNEPAKEKNGCHAHGNAAYGILTWMYSIVSARLVCASASSMLMEIRECVMK